ncbi:PH domain-containing protein [Jeotgalibacillus marinus]|uniref:PH domain-containing protein n=1 Tax=Jeotgalibacillus marinus TaxID=86667 RepID=A0ABV3Q4K1_9BACL
MYFPSKKDWWLTVLICFLMGGTILLSVIEPSVPGIIITTIVSAFLVWIWFTTGYLFTKDELVIRFGPFRSKIPYEKIQSYRDTRSVTSGPALSLDRLEILHDSGVMGVSIVSPVRKEEFKSELERRCPALKNKTLTQ